MRKKTELFKVNGMPMFAPDADVGFSYEDLEDGDSGTDEGGYLHRTVVRHKVGSWSFSFTDMTEEERQYMENLFPDNSDFEFTHPDRLDASIAVTTRAYRTGCSISWQNARTGLWRNYKFDIVEC